MTKTKLPIFLFHGGEDYLIDQKIAALKAGVPNPELNVEIFDESNFSLEALAAALNTQPLLGGEKLVVINNVKINAEIQDRLIALLKGVSGGVRVVIRLADVDRRSKLYKLLEAAGETAEFKPFAPWEQRELVGWIRRQAQARGKKISEPAAFLLQATCGAGLRVLDGELAKLAAYLGERAEITLEDVERLAAPGEVNAFALLDALRQKNLRRSLACFQSLMRNREDVFQLLGLLTTQYRLMLQIKSLNERDVSRIARAVSGSPFFIRKCLENIDDFPLAELRESMESLLDVGLKLRTGEQPAALFDLLLSKLCGR